MPRKRAEGCRPIISCPCSGKQAEIAKINAKMQRLLGAYFEQVIDREAFAS
jgi:hypothetical protein